MSEVPPVQNGWKEWSRHVLAELERHDRLLDRTREDVSEIRGDVKVLHFKSGVWGAVGGMIPVVIAVAFWLLKG